MTEKKLSRREAIKLLGAAAGASVLADLPRKWSKPSLKGGVLSAHAQTSCSIVRTAIVNVPASISTFSYNLQLNNQDLPIIQADFDACPPTQLTFSWMGVPTTGPMAFSVGANSGPTFSSGITSPIPYLNSLAWAIIPIASLQIYNFDGVAWNAGTFTVTFS